MTGWGVFDRTQVGGSSDSLPTQLPHGVLIIHSPRRTWGNSPPSTRPVPERVMGRGTASSVASSVASNDPHPRHSRLRNPLPSSSWDLVAGFRRIEQSRRDGGSGPGSVMKSL